MARGTWQGGGTWQTSGGGGGLVLAVIAAVILAGSASAIASAVVTALIIIACTITAAALAGIGVLIWRARSDRPGAPTTAGAMRQLSPKPRAQLEGSDKPAIEPPREYHLHIHGVSADELAAALHRIDHEE